jgi:1-acyl-sn-glycerol-3-phosphate acyltransferase
MSFQHLSRLLGTGLLFAIFGIGAVILAGLVLPIVVRRRNRGTERDLLAQRWIQRWFAIYVRIGEIIQMWDFEESGTHLLQDRGNLVVANHPSLLDVVFLISRMPQADCVVKREAWSNPALRGIVEAAGYIPNDGAETVIGACEARLRAGRSVILFPEGSRSPANGLGRFKRGAAHTALRSRCRIVPVAISCDPPTLKKGQPWYQVPDSKLKFSLCVGEAFHARDVVGDDVKPVIAARRINAKLRSDFEAGLNHGIA